MKHILFAALTALCIVSLSGPSQAQSKTSAKKVKVYDFIGDDVKGEPIRPGDPEYFVPGQVGHESLIRIRKHFTRQVLRTVEDL